MMDLFKALHDSDISENELCDALTIIENYIVRREICSLPTNALNKVFVQIGAEIERDIDAGGISYFDAFQHEILKRTGKSRFPSNQDFMDKFAAYELFNAKREIQKYILERLENFENRERVDVENLVDAGTLTIEHIMPQTLTDTWRDELGDNWELIHSKYKDTIGNLTLTAYNSDYSNSPFLKKKNMPGKGFVASKLSLNEYVKNCDTWGEEQIIERAKILYQKAEKIWWIPKAPYPAESQDEWVEWDEEYDFTNKRISQVDVLGSIIKTVDVTDAYKKIHELLYELDSAAYYTLDSGWFKDSPEGMRKPYQIGQSAYVETNKSSQEKINTIKMVAKLYGLESYEIRFLIQEKADKPRFEIDDESTYDKVSVGKLAYELIAELIRQDKLDLDEIEKLKTKEYTKQLFSATDYPIVADRRDANKGNSNQIRYRKKPLVFKGKELYITTQWFEPNRSDLIRWYKKHLQ